MQLIELFLGLLNKEKDCFMLYIHSGHERDARASGHHKSALKTHY